MTDIDNTFIRTADMIGTTLCNEAFWSGSKCNWIGRYIVDDNATTSDFSLMTLANHALEPDLYSGTSGIAMFLSYLYDRTKNEEHRRTAEAAITQASSRLEDISNITRIGFYTGYTGIAYAATKVGIILNDNSYVELAYDILQRLQNLETNGHSDHLMDVISGNAGAIPALLEMYDLFHENRILELALSLGDELLSSSVKEQVGLSWDSRVNGIDSIKQNLTGFSHGAAGIGYSLLELFLETDRQEYCEAAKQAFAYENSWFNPQNDNWPDFRANPQFEDANRHEFSYATAWCHGAPGIGLSRLRAYQILTDEKNLNDSLAALRTAVRSVTEMNTIRRSNFSLCHGLAGICDLLLYATSILKDEKYKSVATNIGLYGIDKYSSLGSNWPCGMQTGKTPDLMLGLAGIGYFYLRLSDPQHIPSILIVTPP